MTQTEEADAPRALDANPISYADLRTLDAAKRMAFYARQLLASSFPYYCGGSPDFHHLLWQALWDGDSRYVEYNGLTDKFKVVEFKLSDEDKIKFETLFRDSSSWGYSWEMMSRQEWEKAHEAWKLARIDPEITCKH